MCDIHLLMIYLFENLCSTSSDQADINRGTTLLQGLVGNRVFDPVLTELAVLRAMAGKPHVVQLHSFLHPEGG